MDENKRINVKRLMIKIVVFMCICTCLLTTLFFSNNIERVINKTYFNFSAGIQNSKSKVHFVDVGQGDCTIFELPDGKTMIIDTGASFSADKVVKYLSAIGKSKNAVIDYLVLTHTDSDHIGNAKLILETFNVLNIYMPKVYSNYEVENNLNTQDYYIDTSSLWYETCKAIYNEKDANRVYNFKDVVIESYEYNYSLVFYSPFEDKLGNDNNYSPVIIFNFSGVKFMFVGDIDSNMEQEFLTYYNDVINNFDVDVLKVGHHGSKNSSSLQFLNAVKPEKAIISCGKDNSYSHPNNETINRLVQANCEVLRTDTTSSIVCGIDSNKLTIQTSYDFISSYFFEWWYVVVGGIVLSCVALFCVKIKG